MKRMEVENVEKFKQTNHFYVFNEGNFFQFYSREGKASSKVKIKTNPSWTDLEPIKVVWAKAIEI